MGPSRGGGPLLSRDHPVLPTISDGYPGPRGRLPMPYCPLRRFPQVALGFPRLACLIHAANVRSEPGSNPSKVFSIRL